MNLERIDRLPRRLLRAGMYLVVAWFGLEWNGQPAWAQGGKQPEWPAEGIEDFSLTECHGQTVTKADLLGKPWLASFIFTHCMGPCPVVSEQMQLLQKRLKDLDVRLVSITVDPERDTPEVLRNYAAHYQADPERWWFLTGDNAAIRRLIRGSFKMIVEDPVEPKPGFEIIHSVTIMHVNAEGRVMGQYDARDDVAMARLRRVIRGKSDAVDEQLLARAEELERRQEEARRQGEAAARRAAEEEEPPAAPQWVLRLPAVNASLNALATLLLTGGYLLIRAGRREAHKTAMLLAFVTSCLFLACYLAYHIALKQYTGSGSRKFPDVGLVRVIYLTILTSHVVLAAAVPVLALRTIYLGLQERWSAHRKLARFTFPIWLYVSVTGVIIYWLLYHWAPAVG
jgi:protein SCO1